MNDLAQVSRGRSRHRPRNDASLYGGEHPFIQTADVHTADLYITDASQTYSDKGLQQSRMWEPGTICITIAGENTGDCAILGIRACFPDSIVGLVVDELNADTTFLKYAIDLLKPQLRSITRGATQDNLSVKKLLAFKFPTPPVATQRRIGEILRNYGNLVASNRRRIAALEEAGRQLYDEWFVRLRFPGYEHTRLISGTPEGWTREMLVEQLDFERGIEPGSANYHDRRGEGLVRFIRVGDLGGRPRDTFVDSALAKGRLLNLSDIVISLDGTVGLVRMGLEGAFSSGIRRVVRKNGGTIGWAFIYELLRSKGIQDTIQAHAKGTTIKHAGSALEALRFLRPSASLTRCFEDQVAPLLQQKLNLIKANTALTAARDILLPRLMSGEVAA